MSSRIHSSMKNAFTGVFSQVISIVLAFAVRTVFIYTLSEEYLGINGLLGSVFTVLNLANLGIDGANIYAMYKPMAEHDAPKTKSLLRFYRGAYRIIGCAILAIGLALTPLLPVLAKGSTDLVDLRIIYWLFLAQTVLSYWFFAYLSSILLADQKRYVVNRVGYLVSMAGSAVNIVFLLLLRTRPAVSFYVYTAVGVAFGVVKNLLIRRQAVRRYPWVLDRDVLPLGKEERTSIFKNVAGLFSNNVCRVLNDGIDSTIISAYLGLAVTAVYSNYLMIRLYVLQFIKSVLDPLTESVGNLCAVESTEKKEGFFYSLQFFCFWLYGFCAVCFWNLYNSFIVGVWLHNVKWLLSDLDVFLLIMNFLIEGLAKAVIIYRDANGLFWETKTRYIFSSVFNAVLSVVLVGPAHLGVTGALLGTTASVLIMLSYDPALVYREVFHKRAGGYYLLYFRDLLIVLATGGLVHLACLPFSAFTPLNFLIRLAACLALPNILWYFIYRRDPRFVYLRDTLLGYARGVLGKLRRS